MAAERASDGRTPKIGITMRGRKWVVMDGDREIKSFKPFPASLAEIQATPLYRVMITGAAKLRQVAGEVGTAQAAIHAVSLPRNVLTPAQHAFRDHIWNEGDADSNAIATYGVEAAGRLLQILQWLQHTGTCPARLLVGVSGCDAIRVSDPTS